MATLPPKKGEKRENGNPNAVMPPPAPATGATRAVEPDVPVQLRELLGVLLEVRNGNFGVRVPGHWTGLLGKIGDAFNDVVSANQRMAEQLGHVGQVVGKEGKTRQRVKFTGQSGAWADMEQSVNTLIEDLLWPTTEVTRALAAVAQGNLSQTMRLDVDGRPLQGEFLRSATIVNSMIKQLGRVHLGGDARGARGRHRRKARRPGRRAGRERRVEGPHRERQLHGQQPHRRRSATSPR